MPYQYKRAGDGAPLEGITLKLQEHTGRIFTAWTCETGEAEFLGVWSGTAWHGPRQPPPRGKSGTRRVLT